tara:strand:+ start:1603 stop:2436 length:834 start_codon:yes stop_codon:yes gene_type:complete
MVIENEQHEKLQVMKFWNKASCGEDLFLTSSDIEGFEAQKSQRYDLEPYIKTFANFAESTGKSVLEIGVGLGADHQMFAEAGSDLYGVDLTERAIHFTEARLRLFGLSSTLATGDAEALDFPANTFDIVYSWGVIHHSPNTKIAVAEIHRVLKPGGTAKIMIYNKYSFVGYMLWLRYALLKAQPFISLDEIYAKYLESPGTKAYTERQARTLFQSFDNVKISTVLTHGDLLESEAGQRHRGVILSIAKRIWPRTLIKRFFPKSGLFMLITAQKAGPS